MKETKIEVYDTLHRWKREGTVVIISTALGAWRCRESDSR